MKHLSYELCAASCALKLPLTIPTHTLHWHIHRETLRKRMAERERASQRGEDDILNISHTWCDIWVPFNFSSSSSCTHVELLQLSQKVHAPLSEPSVRCHGWWVMVTDSACSQSKSNVSIRKYVLSISQAMHDGAACSFHWPVSAQLLCTWAMFDGVYKCCSCCKTNVPKKDFTPEPKSFCCHGLFCTVKQSVMDVKVLGIFKATLFFFFLFLKIFPSKYHLSIRLFRYVQRDNILQHFVALFWIENTFQQWRTFFNSFWEAEN